MSTETEDLIAKAAIHEPLLLCNKHERFSDDCQECDQLCDFCLEAWPCLANRLASALSSSMQEVEALRTVLDPDEFAKAVQEERRRQIEKGYDRQHDKAHGIDHLLMWAQEYARQGKSVKYAALNEAARKLIAELRAERDAAVAKLAAAWWHGVTDQWCHRPIGNRIPESANPYRPALPEGEKP